MLNAPHFSPAGAKHEAPFALPAEQYDGSVNEPVLHQTVTAYLNNQRQGTHSTKTRRYVAGGNRKPWKQKGTGRARQGSIRAPHWRGGGVVFGPHPRDYTTPVPKKVKQLARRSALNARAREGRFYVVERLVFATPKTRVLAALLARLGLDGQNVLVLTHGQNDNAFLSSRNLPNVRVQPYGEAAAYDVLWSEALVVEEGAITGVEPETTEETAAALNVKPPTRAPKAAKAPKTAKTAKTAKAAAKVAKAAAKDKRSRAKAKAKPAKSAKKATKPAAKKPASKKKKGE